MYALPTWGLKLPGDAYSGESIIPLKYKLFDIIYISDYMMNQNLRILVWSLNTVLLTMTAQS